MSHTFALYYCFNIAIHNKKLTKSGHDKMGATKDVKFFSLLRCLTGPEPGISERRLNPRPCADLDLYCQKVCAFLGLLYKDQMKPRESYASFNTLHQPWTR